MVDFPHMVDIDGALVLMSQDFRLLRKQLFAVV